VSKMSRRKNKANRADKKLKDNIPFEESKLDILKNFFKKIGLYLLKHQYKIWQIVYDLSLIFLTFSFSFLLLSQVNRLLEWHYLAIFTVLFIAIVYVVLRRIENLQKA